MDHSNESSDDETGRDDLAATPCSFPQSNDIEDTLTSFREQWKRELEISPKHDRTKNQLSKPGARTVIDEAASSGNKARNLFLNGVEPQHSVPDIDSDLHELTKANNKEEIVDKLENDVGETNDNVDKHSEDNDEESNLFIKLIKIVNHNQCVCFPKYEQSTTHISALPMEIVLYILRWVVSPELDLRSLEMFSRVCRGFYISARDAEIWRLACLRVWGANCGTFAPKYQSWREMYLQRPRLRYNGCYVSKISYNRHGENSFHDLFYRPTYVVKYFRCLRFFPEGKVLMLTSTDEAQMCVNSLKCRKPRNPSVLLGRYILRDNFVTLVLNEQNSESDSEEEDGKRRTFHVEFEIQNYRRKVNSQLKWLRYDISTKKINGQKITWDLFDSLPTPINYNMGHFPRFRFSRVKSYAQESEAPLQ